MQLRHIRPGTVDWNDATVDQDESQEMHLGPEELPKHAAEAPTSTAAREKPEPAQQETN